MSNPPKGIHGEWQLELQAGFGPGSDYRPIVDLVVAAAASLDPPLPHDRLDDLRLAVTEACSNAVKVHRIDAAEEPVTISCHLDGRDRFCVDVHDRGPGFDPTSLDPLPDPSDPRRLERESGLGVPLMLELADDVEFRRADDGTIVTLAVDRVAPAGTGGADVASGHRTTGPQGDTDADRHAHEASRRDP